jgi:uncharacterized protein YqgV (UPF0045/DUF77 family)
VPVGPAEVTVEFTINPSEEGSVASHVRAGIDAAEASGLALEVGPRGTGLSGDRGKVLDALRAVVNSAIDAGARSIDIKIEVPGSSEQ